MRGVPDHTKTFVVSLKNRNYKKAFRYLDKRMADLGDVEIRSVQDQQYQQGKKDLLARTVVYQCLGEQALKELEELD